MSVFPDANDDGTMTKPQELPTPCERCGEIPERVFHIVTVTVGSRADNRCETGSA